MDYIFTAANMELRSALMLDCVTSRSTKCVRNPKILVEYSTYFSSAWHRMLVAAVQDLNSYPEACEVCGDLKLQQTMLASPLVKC